MARFRLLTPDAQYADDGVIERQTAGGDVDWDIRRAHSLGELSDESLGACDALVAWHEMKIDAAFVSALRRCRIIVRAGVGFDHIDLAAAAAAGIPVCNTPDYGTSEVADHAIGLMLALRRGIVSYHQNLVADPVGGFDYTRAPLVRRLRGRVFGVVGLGRIGVATAHPRQGLRHERRRLRPLCVARLRDRRRRRSRREPEGSAGRRATWSACIAR